MLHRICSHISLAIGRDDTAPLSRVEQIREHVKFL